MKAIVGNPARKEQFYKRPDVRKDILEAVSSNENLLISAPRRVGKTSILFNLIDDPDENIYAVYVNTEGVDDPDYFFYQILRAILNVDQLETFGKFSREVKSLLNEWANRVSDINLGPVGVKINPIEKKPCYEQLLDFLTKIKLDGKTILLMVDEFPLTIEHIHAKHGEDIVSLFLDKNRVLRQTPEFNHKIKFIYTGSIGLFTAVKRINCTDRVNDLKEIRIKQLKKVEAKDFVKNLLNDKITNEIDDSIIEYILSKIELWIPFYFQLIVKEIAEMVIYEEKELNNKTIDLAFEKVVENGNIYFEHFKSRLLKVFKDSKQLLFVQQFLINLKQKENYGRNETIDLSNKLGVFDSVEDIIDVLKHDGYIVETDSNFSFYSPILKKWWR